LALTTQVRKLYPDMTCGRQKACAAIIQRKINGERVYAGPGYQVECDSCVAKELIIQHRNELKMCDNIPSNSDAATKAKRKEKLRKGKSKMSNSSKGSAITLTDAFIGKNKWLVMAYYCYCLKIQEDGPLQVPKDLGYGEAGEAEEEVRLFTILPLPTDHGQHKFAKIGNGYFYHILKQCGDDEDLEALRGWTASTFCNHPGLDDFWSKYFSYGKFETDATSRLFQKLIEDGDQDDQDLLRIGFEDEFDVVSFRCHPRLEYLKRKYETFYRDALKKVSRKFIRLLSTDGVSVSFSLKSTYHEGKSTHPCVQCLPTPRVPDAVTEECNRLVSFGKYRDLTYRALVELNPSMGQNGDKSYIADYCYGQAMKEKCSQAQRDFVRYASGDVFREPAENPEESEIHELTDEEKETYVFEEIEPWWGENVTESDPSKIILRTTKGEILTVSQMRGKYIWGVDPGHNSLICAQLYYFDKDYRLFRVKGKIIDVRKAQFYQDSGINDHAEHSSRKLKDYEAFSSVVLSNLTPKTTDSQQCGTAAAFAINDLKLSRPMSSDARS
ncbi:hypothetical protein THAOC_07927, partial [Thalassiosira oceanica]